MGLKVYVVFKTYVGCFPPPECNLLITQEGDGLEINISIMDSITQWRVMHSNIGAVKKPIICTEMMRFYYRVS